MSNVTGLLSINPDGRWIGADGNWSTFEIQVGTPPQSVRLLPGTSATASDSIWVVISPGCEVLNTNLTDCASKRGNLFSSNASTTYSQKRLNNNGLFSIKLYEEELLGLTDNNAYYGFDTVSLPTSASNLTVPGQTIAGIATNNFFVGSLGLSPWPLNVTNLNGGIPSLLSTLRNQSVINSTSWAYTAGKSYTNPPVPGSLTLGGYDSARGSQSWTEVPFYSDISRDLMVGLQSITYDTFGSSPLLSNGIYAFMDSLIADMWLPETVCDAFQKAFNLTWSASLETYYVTDAAHRTLLAQEPTFTFTLGSNSTSGHGTSTEIVLPYAAFDLNKTVPDISQTVGTNRYFPLKRAANSSQYTLGRVIFQEAYVIANYDTHTFRVRQAQNSSSVQLVSLAPIVVGAASGSQSSGLSTGAIVGIAIAAVVVVVLLALAMWLIARRKKARQVQAHGVVEADSNEKIELPESEYSADHKFAEMDPNGTTIHELRGRDRNVELHGDSQVELSAARERAELSGSHHPAELASERSHAELAGHPGVIEHYSTRDRSELPA